MTVAFGTSPGRTLRFSRPARGLMYQCVGLWKAAGYAGTGDLLDQSGAGHNLTISAGAVFDTDHFTFVTAESDYMEHADHADFDFAETDSFTVAIALQVAGAPAASTCWMAKRNTAGTGAGTPGWMLQSGTSSLTNNFRCDDGTAIVAATKANALEAGVSTMIAGRRNVSSDLMAAFRGSSPGTQLADSTTATLANAVVLRIGSSSAATAYATMTFYGAAIFRRALSNNELVTLATVLGVPTV